MPANRGLGEPNWRPKPDFNRDRQIQPPVDERTVNFWDETEVAECLIDSGWFEAYEFIPEVNVSKLALESATTLIAKRNLLLEASKKQTQSSVPEEKPEPVQTFHVPSVTCLRTGERLEPKVRAVTPSRSFG